MGPSLNDISLAEEHRRDLLRQAAQSHLADQAAEARRPRQPLYGPALAMLGRWMLAWGTYLTRAYSHSGSTR